MYLVVTDLDGTLLDHDSYSFAAAIPALSLLDQRNIPVVLCTSKTRAETEYWREKLGNRHPFVAENGGAAFIPPGYFHFPIPDVLLKSGYVVREFGTSYEYLRLGLKEAAELAGCRIRGFGDMTVQEIAEACQLPPEQAGLAKLREYDEPFRIIDKARAKELLAQLSTRRIRWTRGGRFYHAIGGNDKATAVGFLLELYRTVDPSLYTIGLGDGLNDAPFLNLMDTPVIVNSRQADELNKLVPRGIREKTPGPVGWNAAMLELISQVAPH